MHFTKAMSETLFGRAITSPKSKGIIKTEVDFSNYTADDFLKYWKSKAKEHNVNYMTVKYKDKAILKSLLKNFKGEDIKLMMDYLWDSGESIILREGKLQFHSYGLYLLSGGFLNSIYNKAVWWRDGIKDTPQRGWETTKEEGSVKIEF